MPGILVVAESDSGALRREFWEVLAAARTVSEKGPSDIVAVACGHDLDRVVTALAQAGIASVHTVVGAGLGEPFPEAHAQAILRVCEEVEPEAVVLAPTILGHEVAARLSLLLHCPLLQDVSEISRVSEGLRGQRYVFGGMALATVTAQSGPWVIVPRAGAFDPALPADPVEAARVDHRFDGADQCRTHADRWVRQTGMMDIRGADVVIAGGKGIGDADGFDLLHEVADLLGGVVGASRPPCDAGWIDTSMQVGLTGKTIAPRLYVAVGISGAIQHLMGCSGAKMVVAVNTDRLAPIFRHATLGVVADWREVMTGLRDGLRSEVGS